MKIVICGATGNIGQQTIDVAKKFNHEIVGITFNSQHEKAKEIIKQLKIPYYLCHSDSNKGNVESFDELLKLTNPKMVINAISGYFGLNISSITLKHKIDLGLANKESMVMVGHWLNQIAKKNKVLIYPIDSEHSSFYKVLKHLNKNSIKNLIITASGGPFWGYSKSQLKSIELKQALNHPTWKMGPKISIDSATLANKAFEIIELFHLFKNKNIIPIRHKQSIVHAIVQLSDNSYIFNSSIPDMKLSIQWCLEQYKFSTNSIIKPLNLNNLNLSFETINENEYQLIKIAKDVINYPNTTRGVVFNVVNDFAVDLFLNKQIAFYQIVPLIINFYNMYPHKKITGLVSINFLIPNLIEKLKSNWKDFL